MLIQVYRLTPKVHLISCHKVEVMSLFYLFIYLFIFKLIFIILFLKKGPDDSYYQIFDDFQSTMTKLEKATITS